MFRDKLKVLRKQIGLTQADLANALGFSQQAIGSWETGRAFPDERTLPRIAKYFGVSIDDLLDCPSPKPKAKGVRIPILGTVIAGVPLEAIEDIIGWEEIPQRMASQGEFFGLQIKGNSMEPVMEEGDIIIVKRQADCNTGDIAVVFINGDESTVKRVQKTPEGIILHAYNPDVYPSHFYSNKDIRTLPVRIWGVVIELRRSLSPVGFRYYV